MFIGYFPDEWILFLSIGAFIAALFGLYSGLRHDVKSIKPLFILVTVIFPLIASSIAFDFYYLHTFSDNGETHPKPLYGCSDLEKYLEKIPAFRNPSPSTWKDLIEQPDCRSGAIVTILVSSLLAWSGVFLLFAFFCLMLRFCLIQIRTTAKPDLNIYNNEMPLSNTDIIQDIPSEYTIESLDGDEKAEKLMECLLNNICIGQDQQPDGWDGHIFREFIIQDSSIMKKGKTNSRKDLRSKEMKLIRKLISPGLLLMELKTEHRQGKRS